MKHICKIVIIFILMVIWTDRVRSLPPEKKKLLSKPIRYDFTIYSQKTVEISEEEHRLYQLIMEFRATNGLPEIPLSVALTYVAQTHAGDLTDNYKPKERCNLNSWSKKGTWSPCCYSKDHSMAVRMWSKPGELTTYSGDGFEIVYWRSRTPTPKHIMEKWKNNPSYNSLLLNAGTWSKTSWKAIGIGIYGNYALAWFGKAEDQDGPPELPVPKSPGILQR